MKNEIIVYHFQSFFRSKQLKHRMQVLLNVSVRHDRRIHVLNLLKISISPLLLSLAICIR